MSNTKAAQLQKLSEEMDRVKNEEATTEQQKTQLSNAIIDCNHIYRECMKIVNDDSQRAPGVNNMSKEQAIAELTRSFALRNSAIWDQMTRLTTKKEDFEKIWGEL